MMVKVNRKLIRVALNFDKELLDIQRIRNEQGFSNPRDLNSNSIGRITEAIPRHPNWNSIKKDIIKSPFKKWI